MAELNEKLVNFGTLSHYDEKIKAKIVADDATTLQSAKDYADEKIGEVVVPEYTIAKLETTTEGYVASYQLKKGSTVVGDTINIPKDYLVKSAEIKTVDTADTPVSGYAIGDKYIDFVVNTVNGDGNESHIYLLVSDLAQTYSAGNGIDISDVNAISVVAQDGTKDVGGITKADYTSFTGAVTKADANETAIAAINNETTGILAQAKAEVKKVDDKVTANTTNIATNTDAIAAINNADTGIEAKAKAYTDEKNTAMDTRVKALEDATPEIVTNDDIDTLFA